MRRWSRRWWCIVRYLNVSRTRLFLLFFPTFPYTSTVSYSKLIGYLTFPLFNFDRRSVDWNLQICVAGCVPRSSLMARVVGELQLGEEKQLIGSRFLFVRTPELQ